MVKKAWLILLLAAVVWVGLPLGSVFHPFLDNAAWAKGSNSGSGSSGSGSSGSGSSGSGSGSSGSGHDDGDDDDHSGSGGGGGGGASASPATGSVGGADRGLLLKGGGGIHVQYADGRIERIRANVFETLDNRGKLVERHPASVRDQRRLNAMEAAIARSGRKSGLLVVAEIDEGTGTAEVIDFRGWRERIAGGRYVLSDPDGRTVARRDLKAADVARIRSMLFLD